MIVKMKNGDISQISEEEKQAYIDYAKKKYPDEIIDEIIINCRITGYLVGTLDRFNNGKRAEEHDRVKHGIDDPKGVY